MFFQKATISQVATVVKQKKCIFYFAKRVNLNIYLAREPLGYKHNIFCIFIFINILISIEQPYKLLIEEGIRKKHS